MKSKKIKSKRYLLIINPISGQSKYKKYLYYLKYYFKKVKIPFDIYFTKYKGHATEIVKVNSTNNNYDVIIGAGGDGTINEVINGMIGSNKKLAIIPWGTGNVFAKEMNLPIKPKKIYKMLLKEKSMKIDLGNCNNKYFYLMASSGFDSYSMKITERDNLKRHFGKLSYLLGFLKMLASYKNPEIDVKIDGKIYDKGIFIIISNISKYAVYFSLTPNALPNDGYLDVFIYKGNGKINLIIFILKIFLNTFLIKNKKLIYFKHSIYKAKNVELSSNHEVYSQLDGDLSEKLPVNIKIMPKAINIILPKKTIKKFKKKLF